MNETLVMRLAGAVGLPTAEIGYRADIRSAVITRYDRMVQGDRLHRLHQADFCQLAGVASDRKYEADGGPSLARETAPGAITREHLMEMARTTGQRPRFVLDTAAAIAEAVLQRLEDVASELKASVGAADHDIVDRVARMIGGQTRRLAARWKSTDSRAVPRR